MGDVQDEDQWLYGDEKEDGKDDDEDDDNDVNKEIGDAPAVTMQNGENNLETSTEEQLNDEKDKDAGTKENEASGDTNDKEDKDEDDDKHSSSDEDDLTVTIGEVKKQSDIIADNIIQPTAHTNRFQPKAAPTSGLKDDDFNSAGKINGVPVADVDINDYEDKPWRKPGADLADYFNYGFVEDSWLKYCEKQKKMRLMESKSGLAGLGGSLIKANVNVPIINDNSKYVGQRKGPIQMRPGISQKDIIKPEGNTIQVMTAERRSYSVKSTNNYGSNGDNMDFGGDLYSNTPYFNPDAPPPSFYNPPPPYGGNEWSAGAMGTPPPTWINNNSNVAPNIPPPDITSGPPPNVYDEDSRNSRRLSPEDERHKSRRSHHGRKSSRSPSRHRRRSRTKSRSRSRSRSPSHKHKRKKSKRDRDD